MRGTCPPTSSSTFPSPVPWRGSPGPASRRRCRSSFSGREGRPGARPENEIGYHAVRAGDNPGEHTILFGLDGESLSVNVRATSRDCYARGALAAAAFLAGKPAGMYSMRDVLGIA